MNTNAYLYYYEKELLMPRLLKNHDVRSVYIGDEYDKYEIYLENNKDSVVSIFYYKLYKVICIMCNKYRDIVTLNITDGMKKVDLLDKKIFNAIFKHGLSENLCKLVIDIDILGNDAEIVELNGHKLLNVDFLDVVDVQDNNSTTKLKLYSIQPYGYKYLVTFRSINKLEFNKKFTAKDIENIVSKFIGVLYTIDWSDKNR